jgi:hypothetical protein
MVKKITSRFRALGLSSLSGFFWLFAGGSWPNSYRVAGWVALDISGVKPLHCWVLCRLVWTRHRQYWQCFLPAITLVLIAATVAIFTVHGLYRSVIRYMGHQAVWDLVKVVSLSTLILGALIFFASTPVPKTVPYDVLAVPVFWCRRIASRSPVAFTRSRINLMFGLSLSMALATRGVSC